LTVVDTTPPSLSCPSGIVLEFQDEAGAAATYSVTATDLCSALNLVVTPPSGSRFPIGVTPVLAQAADSSGNTAQCGFNVTILGAQGIKSNVLAELITLRASIHPPQPFAQKLDEAIWHLANSLDPAWWIDQTHLHPQSGNLAMNEEKLAANTLASLKDSPGCPVDPLVLQGFIDRIVKSDRLLAVISIQDAAHAGLNPRKIAQDLAMVVQGDREAAAGRYANAIEHYRNAWRHALQLRLQAGLDSPGVTRVQFVGNNSESYRIEVSTNMVNWMTLGTCTADAEGNVEFTDSNVGSASVRLYRVVEQ
jgi:hypothetical protein